jgi:hypothetical protein
MKKIKLFQKKTPQVRCYTELIPEFPTYDQFNRAWERIFDYPFEQCEVVSHYSDENNCGFNVKTPTTHHSNGGFGYHTPYPVLKPDQDLYYDGPGPTWSTDANGDRFYYLDKKTGLPYDVEYVVAMQTVRNYFLTGKMKLNKSENIIEIS